MNRARVSVLAFFTLARGGPVAAARRSRRSRRWPRRPSRINHDRAPAGSPIEITYKFVVADDAKFPEDYRVFAHVVDTDEERMWDDDHNPPKPTSQWKPGETVEYTRTIFVPVFPYVGDATFQVGLHSLKDQRRLALAAEDVGQRAYKVAHVPAAAADRKPVHHLEGRLASGGSRAGQRTVEWQWTKKEATLAFKNPKKDAVLYLELDSPSADLHGAQVVQVMMGGQVVEQFTLAPTDRSCARSSCRPAQMGTADMAELQIVRRQDIRPRSR